MKERIIQRGCDRAVNRRILDVRDGQYVGLAPAELPLAYPRVRFRITQNLKITCT